MTNEQREAWEWFRGQVGAVSGRWRVVADAEGFPIVPGRLGRVEWALGRQALAVYLPRRSMRQRIEAIPGVRRHQRGDDEGRWLFPADDAVTLTRVGEVIRPRLRRVVTDAMREHGKRLASSTRGGGAKWDETPGVVG